METFFPTVETEDMSSILQGLSVGSHVALCMSGLGIQDAVLVAAASAADRGERLLFVGRPGLGTAPLAANLGDAYKKGLASAADGRRLVIIDAEHSIRTAGAQGHLDAEAAFSKSPGPGITLICLYSAPAREAIATVGPIDVLHKFVATPGATLDA